MDILIVEDHFITMQGYRAMLKEEIPKCNVLQALNAKEAYHNITSTSSLDLAIIDYQIPKYKKEALYTGIDIALLLKKHHPNCFICIITAYEEAATIYTIHSKAKPHALLIKQDVTDFSFIKTIFSGTTYRSDKVQKAIIAISNHQEIFNEINREILGYLKHGYKVNELENIVFLSESSIKKRIANMRAFFDAMDRNELIKKAIEQKII